MMPSRRLQTLICLANGDLGEAQLLAQVWQLVTVELPLLCATLGYLVYPESMQHSLTSITMVPVCEGGLSCSVRGKWTMGQRHISVHVFIEYFLMISKQFILIEPSSPLAISLAVSSRSLPAISAASRIQHIDATLPVTPLLRKKYIQKLCSRCP